MQYAFEKERKIRVNELNDLEEIKPINADGFPDFYLYPEDNRIAIDINGNVLNTRTGKILKGSFGQNKSIYIHLHDGNNKHTVYLKHRIIARTFIGRPSRHITKDFKDLTVNHIDGDRFNNTISNLEWITNKENLKHAHASGLHPKDRPVIAYNIFSKEQLYFTSTKECADTFGIHRATFFKHLKTRNSLKYHKNGYIFKYESDHTDLNIKHPEKYIELKKSGCSYNVILKNLTDNTTTIFLSIKEAAKYINIPHVTLWRNLTKKKTYRTSELEISLL